MAKSPELKWLRLRQLTERLKPWEQVKDLPPPKGGWIAAIREALGMGTGQLAKRMGVDPTAIVHLETREAAGKITVESLRRAAEAMDSKLVYAIVPNQGLHRTLNAQARTVARARMSRVGHTMSLEAQDVENDEAAHQEADLAGRLLSEWPRSLWDDPEAPKKPRAK
jgi:predicted DNA-binding mobile mystery protein A